MTIPEVLPTFGVNRWYSVRRSGTNEQWHVFAEKYFDSEAEAVHYWESRSGTLGFDRVIDRCGRMRIGLSGRYVLIHCEAL